MKNGIKQNWKIALVNPRVESYSETMPPLGLLYIAALLERNNFKVKIFDDPIKEPFISYPHLKKRELERIIKRLYFRYYCGP